MEYTIKTEELRAIIIKRIRRVDQHYTDYSDAALMAISNAVLALDKLNKIIYLKEDATFKGESCIK